ncbi:ATPase [Prevotella sp. OH937_COT-195]|uniref:ATPase n=1 Tax=Prevotella sp. OH937_COT-195 TaxID=2491051 RepID=UPI000F64F0FA|nr:ATPase [Prevotella sp. OH937_COT-195]RRD02207.1 ATPase [Prevotella sp. OH937_COT-195]
MILVADSGSTKTSWILAGKDRESTRIATSGINPAVQDREEMVSVLADMVSSLPEIPCKIYFYGAGCRGDVRRSMAELLRSVFTDTQRVKHLEVESDLLGASRALFGNAEGIACILGTGSNSCLYDGKNMIENIPPLGYILGDEGSGAAIGKAFLNALFKNELPAWLKNEYLAETRQTYDDIIRRVYREPGANRFLASASMFIAKHIDIRQLADIVEQNIEQFFVKNVSRYSRRDLSVAAVGGMAYVYQSIFKEVAADKGFNVSKILKEPIEALADYHLEYRQT